jgi:hypothetical protein
VFEGCDAAETREHHGMTYSRVAHVLSMDASSDVLEDLTWNVRGGVFGSG